MDDRPPFFCSLGVCMVGRDRDLDIPSFNFSLRSKKGVAGGSSKELEAAGGLKACRFRGSESSVGDRDRFSTLVR